MRLKKNRWLAAVVATLALAACTAAVRPARGDAPADDPASSSFAGRERLLDLWSQALRNNPVGRAVIERARARMRAPATTTPGLLGPATSLPPIDHVDALGNDVLVNDRSLSTCTCSGKPLNQSEVSVAALGPNVLVSWNETRWRCISGGGPRQSFGTSTNYGATFREAGLLYGPTADDWFRGDPVVAVNRKTGAFYIAGMSIKSSDFNYSGIVAIRGHFAGDSFVVDLRRHIAAGAPGDLLDKPWMAVDSLSGNVYFTWSNFLPDLSTQIEFQRCNADLDPIGPVQVLTTEPNPAYVVEASYPAVGPAGELSIAWIRIVDNAAFSGTLSTLELVRSVDLGATFGPVRTMRAVEFNPFSGGPGSIRAVGAPIFSMAFDLSSGPHRGRLYMTWNESMRFQSAPFGSSTAAVEAENNGFFASATPFVVGGKLRGTFSSSSDYDYFKFTGTAGQTFVMRLDSLSTGFNVGALCPSDTTSPANYQYLSYSISSATMFGLPYTGTYYIFLQGPPGTYVASTAFVTATPGDVALDDGDQLLAYTDDGITWSAPVRLNDSAPGHYNHHPEVAVDGQGRVHAYGMDWRIDPICGNLSDQFMMHSGDGGVTWGANRRMTDASSFWGALASCNANNQGDYNQLFADGDRLVAAFTDDRLGDPDIFVDVSVLSASRDCPPDRLIASGEGTALPFALTNNGNFATALAWQVSDEAGWITGGSPALAGTQTLAANGGTQVVTVTVHPPSGCTGSSSRVRFVTHDPYIPGRLDTCISVVQCAAPSGVPAPHDQLSFARPHPNPALGPVRLRYTLSRTGPMRLEIFGVDGRRLRTLERGARAAGPHELAWDGTDESGRSVAAGVYFVRLEAEGRLMSHVVLMRR